MEQAPSSLSTYGVPALLILVVLLILHLLKNLFQPYLFSVFMDWFSEIYNREMESFKLELFHDLDTLREQTSDEKAKLTILEIGVGTGANFKYYPEGTVVVGIEPNKNFAGYLKKNVAKYSPRVRLERTVVARAEDLRGHVDDCSVDAVVSTLVLCSVDDVDAVVSEAKRVLKPGGKFYYLEHVAGDPGSWISTFQWLFHPAWLYVVDRCHLMRTPWVDVDRAGFSDGNYKKFVAPLNLKSLALLRPHAMGVATK